jgi:hypothetical protein
MPREPQEERDPAVAQAVGEVLFLVYIGLDSRSKILVLFNLVHEMYMA